MEYLIIEHTLYTGKAATGIIEAPNARAALKSWFGSYYADNISIEEYDDGKIEQVELTANYWLELLEEVNLSLDNYTHSAWYGTVLDCARVVNRHIYCETESWEAVNLQDVLASIDKVIAKHKVKE